MAIVERVSVRLCRSCRRMTLHVFHPNRAGGEWVCERCVARAAAPELARAA